MASSQAHHHRHQLQTRCTLQRHLHFLRAVPWVATMRPRQQLQQCYVLFWSLPVSKLAAGRPRWGLPELGGNGENLPVVRSKEDIRDKSQIPNCPTTAKTKQKQQRQDNGNKKNKKNKQNCGNVQCKQHKTNSRSGLTFLFPVWCVRHRDL